MACDGEGVLQLSATASRASPCTLGSPRMDFCVFEDHEGTPLMIIRKPPLTFYHFALGLLGLSSSKLPAAKVLRDLRSSDVVGILPANLPRDTLRS